MEGPPAKRALYKESEKGKAQQGAKASSANPASQRNEPAESAVSSSSKGADAHSKDKAVNPGTLEREDSFPMLNSQVHFGQDYVVQQQDSSQSSSQAADLREIRRRGGIVPADEDHAHDAQQPQQQQQQQQQRKSASGGTQRRVHRHSSSSLTNVELPHVCHCILVFVEMEIVLNLERHLLCVMCS